MLLLNMPGLVDDDRYIASRFVMMKHLYDNGPVVRILMGRYKRQRAILRYFRQGW